jgi:hypothetical protein
MHAHLFSFVLGLFAITNPFPGAKPIDSAFFTVYSFNAQQTTINWKVASGYGIWGFGTLGPFGRAAAMIEGSALQNRKKGTVTRDIYVVDAGYGSQGNEVALYIYQKVDQPNGGSDTVTITLLSTVILPLTGGTSSVVSMAGNSELLYIGTNQDESAVEIIKSSPLYPQSVGGVSGTTITSITSDQYGYVAITSGTGELDGGVTVYAPGGGVQAEMSGAAFTLNTVEGVPAVVP